MTLKEALRYPAYEKVIIKKTNTPMAITCIDYSDPQKIGRLTNVSFLLSDGKWYDYKKISKNF